MRVWWVLFLTACGGLTPARDVTGTWVGGGNLTCYVGRSGIDCDPCFMSKAVVTLQIETLDGNRFTGGMTIENPPTDACLGGNANYGDISDGNVSSSRLTFEWPEHANCVSNGCTTWTFNFTTDTMAGGAVPQFPSGSSCWQVFGTDLPNRLTMTRR